MGGCSAFGCSNRSEQGFLMKAFPKDPARRREWCIKVRRDKWIPSKRASICEVHFEPSMWEKERVDGTRRLKQNAVPTIFSFLPKKTVRKPPAKRVAKQLFAPAHFEDNTFDLPSTSKLITEPVPSTSTVGEKYDSSTDSSEIPSIKSISPDSKKKNMNLQNKLQHYERAYRQLVKKNNKYKTIIRKQKREMKTAKDSNYCSKLFNADQIQAASRKSTKFMKWSNATVKKALKLKFACGNNGYSELLAQKMPLPSLRTLSRRLQNLKFDSGILHEVYSFLKLKVDNMKSPHEKDCALILDEMAITPATIYDSSVHKYLGNVSLPNHSGVASHAVVFMIGGITTRWKLTVAYYFTGNSTDGSIYKNILFEIIKLTEEIGLKIVSITSDMGPSNQALWRTLQVGAGRHSKIQNCIKHPNEPNKNIYFFADVPHLFKNIKSMLINSETIIIPEHIREKYNLATCEIKSEHLLDLVNYQEKLKFKIAPKLTSEDLAPSHFQTMKVKTSTHVINHDVSSGLRFIAEQLNKPEYNTTAWFIDVIEKWFTIMSSRHPMFALSKRKLEVYDETILFLNETMEIVRLLKVGTKGSWKPSQSGLLISTQSVLDVQKVLLEENGYAFVLTSRFTQDCLENLFSLVRAKQVIPNASQFKNNLKLICVSQYLKDVSKGSYDEDDRTFLGDFLDTIQFTSNTSTEDTIIVPANVPDNTADLTFSELNSLYHISGYIITSIKKTAKVCERCINSVGDKTANKSAYAKLTNMKRMKKNALFYCNELTFQYILKLEQIFSKYWHHVVNQKGDVKRFYINEMKKIDGSHIINCHNLQTHILRRFLIFRLKIANRKKIKLVSKIYSSRSMAAHSS